MVIDTITNLSVFKALRHNYNQRVKHNQQCIKTQIYFKYGLSGGDLPQSLEENVDFSGHFTS